MALTDDKSMTTAATLIAFRKELLDANIDADRVDELVRDASARIIQSQGLWVHKPPAD